MSDRKFSLICELAARTTISRSLHVYLFLSAMAAGRRLTGDSVTVMKARLSPSGQ